MALFKRILVPVDGSIYSRDAVRLAAQMVAVHGSELKLIHVLDVVLVDQLRRMSKKDKHAVLVDMRHTAHGFLKDMEREARKHNVEPDVLIEEGVPHEAILKEATAWKADLIVMGKLGRRGISHIVLGSVTERVIEFSDAPVLVVK
jgi:nucleotide-binding universal stress UspA family protein